MNRDRVLEICESYESYKEGPADNETIFGKWFGMDRQPWCATSVSKILYEAGNPLPPIQPPGPGHDPEAVGAAYVPYIYNYYKKKGKGIIPLDQARPGDMVLYDWNGDKLGDHIGLFRLHVLLGKSFHAWEGNTSPTSDSNGGEFMKRLRYAPQVLAIINPDNAL